MEKYNFEKSIYTKLENYTYFYLFLGEEYSDSKINENNCSCLTESIMELIEDIFMDINTEYDHWGNTRYYDYQIIEIEKKLSERLKKLEKNEKIIV